MGKRSTSLVLFSICFAALIVLQSYNIYTAYKLEEKIINKEATLLVDSLKNSLEKFDIKNKEVNLLNEYKKLKSQQLTPQEKQKHTKNWYNRSDHFQLQIDSILQKLTLKNHLDIAIRNEIISIFDVKEQTELLDPQKTLVIFKSSKNIKNGFSVNESIWNSYNSIIDTEIDLAEDNHLIVKAHILLEVLNIQILILKKIMPLILLSLSIAIIIAYLYWRSFKNIKIQDQKISQLHTTIDSIAHALNTPLTTLKFSIANGFTAQSKPIIERQINRIETIISAINQAPKQNILLSQKHAEEYLNLLKINYGDYIDKINIDFKFNNRLLQQDFEIILNNLMENAVKYGSKRILIDLEFDKRIQITVIDDGIGIPKEDQSHIYDKYYRVSRNENLQINGLGIGLHLVKNIVDNYQGKIQVNNNPKAGVTFKITLANEN